MSSSTLMPCSPLRRLRWGFFFFLVVSGVCSLFLATKSSNAKSRQVCTPALCAIAAKSAASAASALTSGAAVAAHSSRRARACARASHWAPPEEGAGGSRAGGP